MCTMSVVLLLASFWPYPMSISVQENNMTACNNAESKEKYTFNACKYSLNKFVQENLQSPLFEPVCLLPNRDLARLPNFYGMPS